MKPEILAKILRIIGKTEEKVVVIDEISGDPYVFMNLDAYERIKAGAVTSETGAVTSEKGVQLSSLTRKSGSGIIDPESALLAEARESNTGDWGGDPIAEEGDRYYMEPAE